MAEVSTVIGTLSGALLLGLTAGSFLALRPHPGTIAPAVTTPPVSADLTRTAAVRSARPVPASLTAEAARGPAGEVLISGVDNAAHSGDRVVVQRRSGGRAWRDFPAEARVGSAGHYRVRISSDDRAASFRVRDDDHRTSPAVTLPGR